MAGQCSTPRRFVDTSVGELVRVGVQLPWYASEGRGREEGEQIAHSLNQRSQVVRFHSVSYITENTDVPAWRASLALLHTRRGDDRAARAEFETLAVDDFRMIPRDAAWLNAMTYLAETCAFLQDERRAALLFQTLEPYARRVALIDRALACKGSVDRFLGLLAATAGKVDAAERLLRSALKQHEAMHAIPLTDRTSRELRRIGRD